MLITSTIQIRPRYGEVDQMGYVYHANYVSYCHQARTELFRKLGIHDQQLEQKGIILPVISFDIKYKKPAHYDERISVKATLTEMPMARMNFEFEVRNEKETVICTAKSSVVFANSRSRLPIPIPNFVEKVLITAFENITSEAVGTRI